MAKKRYNWEITYREGRKMITHQAEDIRIFSDDFPPRETTIRLDGVRAAHETGVDHKFLHDTILIKFSNLIELVRIGPFGR